MAFEKFESDRESLVQGAGQVRSTRTDVSGDLSKLRNVIDDLVAQGWHGTASQGFQQVMSSWDSNAQKLMVSLDEIAKLLDNSGAQFTANDEEQQRQINSVRDYSGALGGRL